jgi:hypothetical protein
MLKLAQALFLLLSFALAQTGQSQDVQNGGDFSNNPDAARLPSGVILIKGAAPSSSDSETPVPESGLVTNQIYANRYFRLTYPLPADFVQTYEGPPPSDTGYYVLAELNPAPTFKAPATASILISAQDIFFSLKPITSAGQFIRALAANLNRDLYQIERPPIDVKIAAHSFTRFDYTSPVAGLHWYVFATQVRCHVVQFTFTSRDTALLNTLVQGMAGVSLPDIDSPACLRNYASANNVVQRVEPVFADRKFNSVPVRLVISKEGEVKYVHVISAFPEQASVLTESLQKWLFKPYAVNGAPVEVETGILFGASRQTVQPATAEVQ